jgi:hypothetical protein
MVVIPMSKDSGTCLSTGEENLVAGKNQILSRPDFDLEISPLLSTLNSQFLILLNHNIRNKPTSQSNPSHQHNTTVIP